MYETAKITNKLFTEKGLYMQVFIPGSDVKYFCDKNGDECGVWFNDNRTITAEQRKKIYSLLYDMSIFTGYTAEEMKQTMKIMYMVEKGLDEFSLKNCSLVTASEFIDFLIDFCFREDITLNNYGIERTCNVNKYLYLCLKYKKCCICGKPADEHHEDAIGMGNNRKKVDDSKKRKTSLCRIHHTERHTIGELLFNKKYHVYGIIYDENEEIGDTIPLLDVIVID